MIEKFNLSKRKEKNRWPASPKTLNYHVHKNVSEIRNTLEAEAVNYVRIIHKVPCDKKCYSYRTKDNKIAVMALDTPKKRLEYNKAWDEYKNGNIEPMKEFEKKYGFIPRPANVLKKFVQYGLMKSQDVEHLYHNLPVDYQITDAKAEMMSAYGINLEERDVVAPGFNGYSCMSEEPDVGAFYYYFGAYMLIFYAKGTSEIVGRMVLWKWKDQFYARKGYVRSQYQFAAKDVVEELTNNGTLRFDLPSDFHTSLQRIEGKTPLEIYEQVSGWIRVPYIDEDLMLNCERTELSYDGDTECKSTDTQTLAEYGNYTCYECGDDFEEEDIVWVDDNYYCTSCARCCVGCDEWFAPDDDGEYTRDGWVCENCLGNYKHCEECDEWVYEDEVTSAKDKDGDVITVCCRCAKHHCKTCDECDCFFFPQEEETLCYDCKNEKTEDQKKEA